MMRNEDNAGRLQRFTLTEDHVLLLSHGNVDCSLGGPEWGYVGLDCKRPFGNGGMVDDIVELLSWPTIETDAGAAWPKGTRDKAMQLYSELGTALQIILVTKSFAAGEYVASEYRTDWRKCNGKLADGAVP